MTKHYLTFEVRVLVEDEDLDEVAWAAEMTIQGEGYNSARIKEMRDKSGHPLEFDVQALIVKSPSANESIEILEVRHLKTETTR